MKDLYVVNCCRTAIGSFGGSLKNTPAAEMGAVVVKEALKRANIAPENVDEVMFGCILTAAQGQNVARQVAIKAGIPYSVPAYTVGMVCGSGMKSVIEGARSILAGDSDVVVCGGTENMSAAPFASLDARWGARMGDKKLVDTMIKDGLWDAYNNYHMGTTAENINDIWGITREEQDAFAAASQQKTEAAQKAGRFDDEIVPELTFDRPYLLAMANAGLRRGRDGKAHGTNGSQFFITTVPTPWLDGHHTIFGEVADDESKAVVDKLEAVPTDRSDAPLEPAGIMSIEVVK